MAAGGNAAYYGNPVFYPAADPDALAVAAVTPTDARAGFSSFGTWIDLAAPGTSVLAPCPAGAPTCGFPDPRYPGYARLSGTSMAAPHVSAAAALLLAAHPGLDPASVRSLLLGAAQDLGAPGSDPEYGAGLVDPLGALARAGGPPSAPTGLSAVAAGRDTVRLSWSAPPSVALGGFRLARDGAPLATVGPEARSFTDTGRQAGSTPTYEVRAFDVTGAESPAARVQVGAEPAGGYRVVGRDGRMAAFGSAAGLGDASGLPLPLRWWPPPARPAGRDTGWPGPTGRSSPSVTLPFSAPWAGPSTRRSSAWPPPPPAGATGSSSPQLGTDTQVPHILWRVMGRRSSCLV